MKGSFAAASMTLCRTMGRTVAALADPGATIIELGCGNGRVCHITAQVAGTRPPLGVDIAPQRFLRCDFRQADATDAPPWLREEVGAADVVLCSLPLVAMRAAGQDVAAAWRLMRTARAVVGYTLEPFWPAGAPYGTWRARRWVANMTPACVWVYRRDGVVGSTARAGECYTCGHVTTRRMEGVAAAGPVAWWRCRGCEDSIRRATREPAGQDEHRRDDIPF